jgi:hypothetical protein
MMISRKDEKDNLNKEAVKNSFIENIRRKTLKSFESETGYTRQIMQHSLLLKIRIIKQDDHKARITFNLESKHH